jgi:CBS domain containing-hemolysin-like protein
MLAPDLEKLNVSELMRPAHEMVYLSAAHSQQHNLELVQRTRFSRYPLFADDGETLLGMVHFKDLFPLGDQGVDFRAIARKALIVPPDMRVPDLFHRFRRGGSHFALVGYPGEHPEGFLTIDNLLGAMLGEIRDEFRHDGGNWNHQDDGSLLGKGSLSLYSLKRALGIELPDMSVDSVGGLVMARLDRLPAEGERIEFPCFNIVIKRMQGPRILLLKVIPAQPGGAPLRHAFPASDGSHD